MDYENALKCLSEDGILTTLDLRFGEFVAELEGRNGHPALSLAASLVSRMTRNGHICLDLGRIPEAVTAENIPVFPEPLEWRGILGRMRTVGSPGSFAPLVLDEAGRLYLHRYWEYQEGLARRILERAAHVDRDVDKDRFRTVLRRLFPGKGEPGSPDRQKIAACVAGLRRLTIVSGGPGTGKTTTVCRLLALLSELAGPTPPRIALAAPTGKAAARLGEAVRGAVSDLPCAPEVVSRLPASATTIHRLLGTVQGSPFFRHNAENRLALDVLVVDEASMVDLALMAKLLDAVPEHARVVLMGDHHQLASVEAGAVLGDICEAASARGFSPAFTVLLEELTGDKIPDRAATGQPAPLGDSIVILEKSYRFEDESGLGDLGRAVNHGDSEAAMELLAKGGGGIRWFDMDSRDKLYRAAARKVLDAFPADPGSEDVGDVLDRFERFRILCALREGPYGARAVNRVIEKALLESRGIRMEGPWYSGRPVMILRNDYQLELFNGDTGVALPSPRENGALGVCFPDPGGGLRWIHPARLPEHETAFAMTVHKSQGSEFDRILLILPDRPSPVLTRELIYTAVTRARKAVEIRSPKEVLRTALSTRTLRGSGLRDALRRQESHVIER